MANIVILGLTITSSWGNGHATTYRALVKALAQRGHEIAFLERDVPWYSEHRDQPESPFARIALYENLNELPARFGRLMADADAVIVGSYVPDGIVVGEWAIDTANGPVAFYDIDTPVTLTNLQRGECEYLLPELIRRYDLYLSFTGGPALTQLEEMGSPRAAALYCSVDPEVHAPVPAEQKWLLGYLGTYSADRQPGLERTLFALARQMPGDRFVVAGAQYPNHTAWPENVEHIPHLPPAAHPEFYCSQQFTLNLTRSDMRALGYSPSVRLFEAAACGVPIVSDNWPGLETFFTSGREIVVAESADEIASVLRELTPEKRKAIAAAARKRVLAEHTAAHRTQELEALLSLGAHTTQSHRLQRRAHA
jgi:spore maturation protein CgeB